LTDKILSLIGGTKNRKKADEVEWGSEENVVRTESKDNEESIQRWFDKEVEDGENPILV
jgi:hypothetical protein